MDSGKLEKSMVLGKYSSRTAAIMKDNLIPMKSTETDIITGKTVKSMKDSGNIIRCMEKEN